MIDLFFLKLRRLHKSKGVRDRFGLRFRFQEVSLALLHGLVVDTGDFDDELSEVQHFFFLDEVGDEVVLVHLLPLAVELDEHNEDRAPCIEEV